MGKRSYSWTLNSHSCALSYDITVLHPDDSIFRAFLSVTLRYWVYGCHRD